MKATFLIIFLAVMTMTVIATPVTASDSTIVKLKAAEKDSAVVHDTLSAQAIGKHQLIVYYFHGTQRCSNCIKIEAYTKEVVDSSFATQLKDSVVVWRLVNTDEDANKHFRDDYQLFTRSVVISDLSGDKQIRWKNLDKIWEYLENKATFQAYIRDEVAAYLKAE